MMPLVNIRKRQIHGFQGEVEFLGLNPEDLIFLVSDGGSDHDALGDVHDFGWEDSPLEGLVRGFLVPHDMIAGSESAHDKPQYRERLARRKQTPTARYLCSRSESTLLLGLFNGSVDFTVRALNPNPLDFLLFNDVL